MSNVPAELKFSAEHEWIDADHRVGVTQFAADQLGDVVYVELPDIGQFLTAGAVCGEIESTKSVSDLYSPITGEVLEVNAAVVEDPSIVNSDPYGAGWLFTVRVTSEGPLLTAAEYAAANDIAL